jgi:ribosomal protein RSM22 (predicted rRNA methylase)
MFYPDQLQSEWLTLARESTGCDHDCDALSSLEKIVARLSDQFTIARPDFFHDYTTDPMSLAAYGVFFFPQTFMRMRSVLREWRTASDDIVFAKISNKNRPFRILDLGCGTGASTLAAAMSLRDQLVSVTAVDHSSQALACLRRLFAATHDHLCPSASLETVPRDAKADGVAETFDLIIASFLVNELFPSAEDAVIERWLRTQLDRLSPHGTLILVDPAGATTCERIQRLRNRFAIDPNIAILAPCPHDLPCPMFGAERGWCHDVRSWRVPNSVNLINRNMFRSVHDLKHGLLILGRRTPENTPPAWRQKADCFRMAAPMKRTKGCITTCGCFGDGKLHDVEIMTRSLSHAQKDALMAFDRGDVFRAVGGCVLGDGRTRRVDALEPLCAEVPTQKLG